MLKTLGDKEFLSRILLPVDSSASSLRAEETAAMIAKKTEATVTVIHIIPTNLSYEKLGFLDVPRKVITEILGHAKQEGEKIISDSQDLFIKEEIRVDTKTLRSNDPAESILEFQKNDYDLIVMGAHGENEKDPYALGSVTKKVLSHAACPTLIVKGVCSLSNLLVCIDGSENSLKALDYALKLAKKMGSKVTLLHVLDHKLQNFFPDLAEEMGERLLSKALDEVGGGELEVDKRLEFGVPPDIIVEVAEKENHDLIVLGSKGLGDVRRFLLGSVSDDVSHKAKSSVLIVPLLEKP
jgi:nucleotide-binding universal stress UspA family protein